MRDIPDRTSGLIGRGYPSFDSEFVVEIPRTVDISTITGVSDVAKIKFHRVGDIDTRIEVSDA